MTALNYTTGDPTHLTAGATASMNDISGPFADIKTFLAATAATLDYGNLAAVVDSYYKSLHDRVAQSFSLTANTYVFTPLSTIGLTLPTTGTAGAGVFYLDTATFPSGTRTPKLRLAANWLTNNVAPAVTYTYGLYQVTAVGGGAGATTVTLSAVVAGSTVANVSPAATLGGHGESSDIAFPAAGHYILGFTTSGTEVANSYTVHRVALQFRAT